MSTSLSVGKYTKIPNTSKQNAQKKQKCSENNKRLGKKSISSEAPGLSMPTMAAHLNEVPDRDLSPGRRVISFSPFFHPHLPHGALIQLRIVSVLGFGITEHVCEAGAEVQVTEEIGFEVENFQVDIHLICHAL
jgi:hypothetical protein